MKVARAIWTGAAARSGVRLSSILLALSIAVPAQAGPVNLDFEAGLAGWGVMRPVGDAVVARDAQGQMVFGGPAPAGQISAMDLFQFGPNPALSLESIDASTFATVNSKNGIFVCCDQQFDIYLDQTLELVAGTIVTGWARFANGDYLMRDSAWVRVMDDAGTSLATPWLEYSGSGGSGFPGSSNHLNSVPFQSTTQWVQWQWSAPATETYHLRLGVSTSGDADLASYGLYDNIQVPEPATLALTLLGAGLVVARRSRRRTQ